MSVIQKALTLAYEQHQGQNRKCNHAPYFVHILDVARHLMSEPTATEDVIVAGILHDTLEDTSYTVEDLESDFGPRVRQLVEFVTEPAKDSHSPTQDKRQTWKQRKQHTLETSQTATCDQLLILQADKLSNLQSIQENLFLYGETLWNQFNASRTDTSWYYQELGKVFRERIKNTKMNQLYERLLEEVF